jgi:hypothetical protein
MLAQVVDRGMTAKKGNSVRRKGTLGSGQHWRRLKLHDEGWEACEESVNLKALEVNSDRLLDLIQYVDRCPKEKCE